MTTTSDEEEETMLDSEEEEEEEEEDSDEEYELSQRDKNLVRERNVRALRDGTVKIAYASVLSNLKPPEPNEVILKRHFQPLVPGGALQTGKRSLVERVDVFFVIFFDFERFVLLEGEGKERFWVLTFEKKNSPSFSLFPRVPDVLFLASILTLSFSLSFFLSSGMQRRCNARFSPEKYSSRLAQRNDRNCRKSYRPARTRKISHSRKVFQSWCCGKTRIRKGRRRISCYLR